MKKFISIALIAALSLLLLAGCGKDKDTEPTPRPIDSSAPDNTQSPDDDDKGGDDGIPGATSSDVKPFEDDSETGAIFDAIYEKLDLDEMPQTIKIDEKDLEGYYGLTEDDIESHTVRMSMMNTNATEIAIIKAKPGKEDAVKDAFQKRLEDLESTWSEYLPDQYEMVENHTIVQNGQYLLLSITTQNDVVEDAFNAQTK